MVQRAPPARRSGWVFARLFAPLLLLAVAGAIALIVSNPPNLAGPAASHGQRVAAARRLPPYWTVRPGDTLAQISAETGVSVDLLQAYNPTVNPLALAPGERLNLWRTPPKPPAAKRKRAGTDVLDGQVRPVVRLDRGEYGHQHRHARTAEPEAEAGDASAGR